MKETGKRVKKQEREYILVMMEAFMKVIGKMIYLMEKVYFIIKMEIEKWEII